MGGALLAEATLPAGEVLLSRLLSLGGGVRVLEPASLAEALRARAEQIAALYGGKQPPSAKTAADAEPNRSPPSTAGRKIFQRKYKAAHSRIC